MKVLAIETSCDETAASIVESHKIATDHAKGEILSNIVYSQIDEHKLFGGVVPEIASRAHLSKLDYIIEEALQAASTKFKDIDAIAATSGPGLIGGLMTGMVTAKAIAASIKIPFYAINHLEGHALTPRLTDGIAFPYLLLLVSGGHTQFVIVHDIGHYERISTTIDDALGEAFDKTAKLLSLGYPGGPQVEKFATKGNPKAFPFPRPLNTKVELNFSFSGLKTAVRKVANENAPLNDDIVADICASFQAAVIDVLIDRTKKAFTLFDQSHVEINPKNLVVAGGVAANKSIRSILDKTCAEKGWNLIAPPLELCTDNAAMIGWAALERMNISSPSPLNIEARSRWPLDEKSQPFVGSGKKGAKA